MGILIIELQDQLRQGVVGIERFGELTTDIRQLEVEEVGMTGLKIVKKRLNGDALVGLEISIPIDGEVDHCQERVGVDMIVVTGLLYGLVAET